MTSELEQLKIAYETLGMSPEAIATDRELDINAVKAGLMQCSPRYRRDCGAEPAERDELNFSDQDLRDVNDVIRQTALYAEDERLRFQAAIYIRDDKKGRKEVVKQLGNQTFNILQFNESMKAIRERAAQVIDVATSQPILTNSSSK